MTYTLYSMQNSGNCYKPRLLLRQIGQDFRLVDTNSLDGSTRKPDFLALNPNGKVPLLVLPDGRRLAESNAMLLQALVACAGVTLNAVATSLSLPVRDAKVRAEGELDVRGTLGVDRSVPVGFRHIRLGFEIDGDLSAEQRQTLVRLTERYCVVLQTIRSGPTVTVTVD
jgi:uncharacterized OsmC-like protein